MSELPEYPPEYKSKPYKRRGMTTPQKLMVAGGFLAFVAFAIGGEDRPGIVTMAQKTITAPGASDVPVPNASSASSQSQQQITQQDAELSDWYASSSPASNSLIGADQQDDSDDGDSGISAEEDRVLREQINNPPFEVPRNN